jgi:glycosyltransferase involved in cell wall biosynthesis
MNRHPAINGYNHALLSIAVLIPCYNEAGAITDVIRDFAAALPGAKIFVYDNNSNDGTGDAAKAAGAIVRREERQGKGNVVRRMFADVDADVYIMVDGDGTYDASAAPRLVKTLLSGPYDMVNATRIAKANGAYRAGHVFGNMAFTRMVGLVFGGAAADMLSGYKAFSRRFVKTFPAMSGGFEIETELMIHALELRLPIAEIEADYAARPLDQPSKLRTFHDGARILRFIGLLVKQERPLQFFTLLAMAMAGVSLFIGVPVVREFLATGLVPRLPSAVLASALMLCALHSFFAGLILDTVTQGRREQKRLRYLQERPVSQHVRSEH